MFFSDGTFSISHSKILNFSTTILILVFKNQVYIFVSSCDIGL